MCIYLNSVLQEAQIKDAMGDAIQICWCKVGERRLDASEILELLSGFCLASVPPFEILDSKMVWELNCSR